MQSSRTIYSIYIYNCCMVLQRLKEAAEAEKARRGKTFNRDKEQRKEWEEMQRRVKAAAAVVGSGASSGAPPPP